VSSSFLCVQSYHMISNRYFVWDKKGAVSLSGPVAFTSVIGMINLTNAVNKLALSLCRVGFFVN
jgi:hypothetical protein